MRIVFDLDGTLIDSAADIHLAANAVLAEFGFAPLTFAQVKSFIGRGVPHLVHRLLAASEADPQGPLHAQVMAAFVARYEDAVTMTVVYPGVPAALASLAARGARLGICTNKPLAPALAVLRHVGLADLFDVVLGGDSLPERKPDPKPLLETFARLGSGPMAYVGDSEVDAETAARGAVPFALFTEGYRKAPVADLPHDAAFDDYAALPRLIDTIAR